MILIWPVLQFLLLLVVLLYLASIAGQIAVSLARTVIPGVLMILAGLAILGIVAAVMLR